MFIILFFIYFPLVKQVYYFSLVKQVHDISVSRNKNEQIRNNCTYYLLHYNVIYVDTTVET